jgi:hypothetical protein
LGGLSAVLLAALAAFALVGCGRSGTDTTERNNSPDASPGGAGRASDGNPKTPAGGSEFDHAANTKAALKKKIIEVSYTNAVQPVTNTFEAMCKPQRFKDVIGMPDSGDTSAGKNKLWTYRCSDGAITFRVHVLGNSAIQIVKIERE